MLEEIKYKVVSYCDIPEEITQDSYLQECSCDCYMVQKLPNQIELDHAKYTLTNLDKWLIKTYPELIGNEFMIHIDY